MKFQWSIQSSHIQLAQNQVTYLTSRNEHIWPSTKVFTLIESFLFGFHFSYFFINITQFFSSNAVKFFIFLWWIRACLVLKKWSLITHHSVFITHHSVFITRHSSLITQTLFFHSLKIKLVWFHFLFYVTQNFTIMVEPIYCTGLDR